MASQKKSTAKPPATPPADNSLVDYPSVEKGIWTPIPGALPKDASHRLKLKEIDPKESQKVKDRGTMTFHAVGCSGCFEEPEPGRIIGAAMAAQLADPAVYGGSADKPSFFYHLGDIVYKADADADSPPPPESAKDQGNLYATQFYTQYDKYQRSIFAIPGNHDSKSTKHDGRSAITHFIDNFCDTKSRHDADGKGNWRKTMTQPYPYWLLETPVAYIVGLATNDINGGQLDDPIGSDEPQYQWLLNTLNAIKTENLARAMNKKTPPKAVLLAIHYPPYSGAGDFAQRGDPNLGPTPRPTPRNGYLLPLGMILHRAFHQTQQYPDAVLSAHAHLYQRLTYTLTSGRQIPYLIAGSGGHYPVEPLTRTGPRKNQPKPATPFPVILPPGLNIPQDDDVQVVHFNDRDFGFLRVTVDLKAATLTGEFFAATYDFKAKTTTAPKRKDSFVLDLEKHTLR